MDTADIIAKVIEASLRKKKSYYPTMAKQIADVTLDHFGRPRLPVRGETMAIATEAPKTAALFFDRVWSPPHNPENIPDEIQAYGATSAEMLILAMFSLSAAGEISRDDDENNKAIIEALQSAGTEFLKQHPSLIDFADVSSSTSRAFCEALASERGIQAVPMYSDIRSCEREYAAGKTELIVAAISDLQIVDESKISWPQVVEFRKDGQAKTNLRRMRNWLDQNLIGKPLSQVSDSIAIKIENYDDVLKKHGIETVVGSMSDFLEPATISATSAAIAGLTYSAGGIWAALGGATILAARASLSLTRKFVDYKATRDALRSEVAFVHELKKLTK
jgi:hypothetical protein